MLHDLFEVVVLFPLDSCVHELGQPFDEHELAERVRNYLSDNDGEENPPPRVVSNPIICAVVKQAETIPSNTITVGFGLEQPDEVKAESTDEAEGERNVHVDGRAEGRAGVEDKH